MPELTAEPRHQSGGLAVALAKLNLDALTVADGRSPMSPRPPFWFTNSDDFGLGHMMRIVMIIMNDIDYSYLLATRVLDSWSRKQ